MLTAPGACPALNSSGVLHKQIKKKKKFTQKQEQLNKMLIKD